LPAADALRHLVALQAQWPPSAYVALWSRLQRFQKNDLTASPEAVKASTLRGTLHVVARDLFPMIMAAVIESRRGRTENLGVDVDALRRALPRRPLQRGEAEEIARRVLGTDDRWTVAFALRAIPFVREGVVGPWPHTKPPPLRVWRNPLPDAQTSSAGVVHAFLAAYGPATRDDVERFTGFRIRQIEPALAGLEVGHELYDIAGALPVSSRVRAPVRFLPAYDSMVLAHLNSGRVVPPEYVSVVYNRRNATCKSTFTVDGFVAGTWRIDRKSIVVEPFAPLSTKWQAEADAEAARLGAWWADGERSLSVVWR
jgi:hypothetical protein